MLQWNRIGNNGAKDLGEGISKCVILSTLKLNLLKNKIGESGGKYLGEGISKCGTLTSLDL